MFQSPRSVNAGLYSSCTEHECSVRVIALDERNPLKVISDYSATEMSSPVKMSKTHEVVNFLQLIGVLYIVADEEDIDVCEGVHGGNLK